MLGKFAQQRIAQTIQTFEMFKQKDEPFEMRSLEFAIDAVERMRDGVKNLLAIADSVVDRKCYRAAARSRCVAVPRFPRPEDLLCMGLAGNKS